jgi:hypothetical protein
MKCDVLAFVRDTTNECIAIFGLVAQMLSCVRINLFEKR